MTKLKRFAIPTIVLFIIAFIFYYITLPAINIHSRGFWFFLIGLVTLITIALEMSHSIKSIFFKISGIVLLLLIALLIIGSLLSSPILNASKYQKLITVTEQNFKEDIKPVSYNEIPILDKDSAKILGSRKMGSIVEYVSQFEVAEDYIQINYQDTPVRVTPLKYGSIFKWIGNQSKGIPAYLRINMSNQDIELVKLEEGMKYTRADHFQRNIYRHLRFQFPTYIFDHINFEIDDNDTPYYVCPVKDYTIGLFGGESIKNVVLVNAINGDTTNYKIDEVPTWIDRVYSADLLISYYDYYGTLKHGYWNSRFGQRDALQTTEGYNYLVLDDDVWVYTGVTSVGGDESNVGFVIMNQRTAETRYYAISGAEEYSAMSSAEGQVQHLGYTSTFPLLLNIAGEPTYFIALKDAAGLVKKYAMVNIEKYQNVAIGDTISECEKTYVNLLKTNGVTVTDTSTLPSITGVITKIAEGVVDGNSHYYIMMSGSPAIFDVSVVDYINIIKYNVGDLITLTYSEGENVNIVLGIE